MSEGARQTERGAKEHRGGVEAFEGERPQLATESAFFQQGKGDGFDVWDKCDDGWVNERAGEGEVAKEGGGGETDNEKGERCAAAA